jgi:hypothetical protein
LATFQKNVQFFQNHLVTLLGKYLRNSFFCQKSL